MRRFLAALIVLAAGCSDPAEPEPDLLRVCLDVAECVDTECGADQAVLDDIFAMSPECYYTCNSQESCDACYATDEVIAWLASYDAARDVVDACDGTCVAPHAEIDDIKFSPGPPECWSADEASARCAAWRGYSAVKLEHDPTSDCNEWVTAATASD